jgi:hypothetical protein
MVINNIIIGVVVLSAQLMAQIPTQLPGWPYNISPGGINGNIPSYGIADNNNFTVNIGMRDHRINCFFPDLTQPVGWPILCDTLLWDSYAIVADFDHDNRNEYLIDGTRRVESSPHYLYTLRFLFDDDGSVMAGFPIRYINPCAISTADFDGDNEYEIMNYSPDDGTIGCIDRWGNYKPGWPVELPYDVTGGLALGGGGAVGDLDLDGRNEYIIGGAYHIYAYRYDGTMQNGFPIMIPDSTYYFSNYNWSPILADIDNDGFLEIMIAANHFSPFPFASFVAIYEHDGTMRANWPIYFADQLIRNAPTPSDINNDGILELGFQAGELYYVNSDAEPLAGWPVNLYSPNGAGRGANSDLITVDIDGDGDCEIFMDYNAIAPDSVDQDSNTYYGHSYLFAMDHLGQQLPGYPIEVDGEYIHRPPVFYYEVSRRRLYMALFSDMCLVPHVDIDTAYLSLYVFPDSTGPANQWPRLSHDNLMTRNYNFVDRVTSIHDESEILPNTYILKQNYPNPFNGETIIEYVLPKRATISLNLYDILGRKIIELNKDDIPAGTHKQRLILSDFPSGVYLYSLETKSCKITRKMTILK